MELWDQDTHVVIMTPGSYKLRLRHCPAVLVEKGDGFGEETRWKVTIVDGPQKGKTTWRLQKS